MNTLPSSSYSRGSVNPKSGFVQTSHQVSWMNRACPCSGRSENCLGFLIIHFPFERQRSATQVSGATCATAQGVTLTGVGCIALLGFFILSFHLPAHHRGISANTPQPRYSRV